MAEDPRFQPDDDPRFQPDEAPPGYTSANMVQRLGGPPKTPGLTYSPNQTRITTAANSIPILGPLAQHASAGISSLITGRPYLEHLQGIRDMQDRSEKANPDAAFQGKVGGFGLSALIPGSSAIRGLSATGKGLALAGAAASDAGLRSNPGSVAKNAMMAAAMAPVVSAGVGKATDAIGNVGSSIKNRGLRNVAKFFGGTPADRINEGEQRMNQAAEDAINQKWVRPFGGREATLRRATQARDELGPLEGELLANSNATVDLPAVAEKMRRSVVAPAMSQSPTAGVGRKLSASVNDMVSRHAQPNPAALEAEQLALREQGYSPELTKHVLRQRSLPVDPVPVSDADALKRAFVDVAKPENLKQTPLQEGMGRLGGVLNGEIENSMRSTEPELAKQFLATKRLFGSANIAERQLTGATARTAPNTVWSAATIPLRMARHGYESSMGPAQYAAGKRLQGLGDFAGQLDLGAPAGASAARYADRANSWADKLTPYEQALIQMLQAKYGKE